jgi:hypothetical protein
MRMVSAWIILTFTICAAASGEGTSGTAPNEISFLWRMTVSAPSGVNQGLTTARLYPEICKGVRYFRITPGERDTDDLPWRIEKANGEEIANSYAVLYKPLDIEQDVFLVFPVSEAGRSFRITAYAKDVPANLTMKPAPKEHSEGGVEAKFYAFDPQPDENARKRWYPSQETFRALIGDKAPIEEKRLPNAWLTTPPTARPDYFVAHLTGNLVLPVDGPYAFAVDADDQSIFTVTQEGTTITCIKRKEGMFEGEPTGISRGSLKAGAAKFDAWLREDTGAQGIMPYWMPPGYTKPVIIPARAFGRYPEAKPLRYEATTGAPYPLITSEETAAFNCYTGQDTKLLTAVFDIDVVAENGLQRYDSYVLKLNGFAVNGHIAAEGEVSITDPAAGRMTAGRRLFTWNQLAPETNPAVAPYLIDDLIIREKTVVSTPTAYEGEEVSVGQYREIVSSPPLDETHLPLLLVTTRQDEPDGRISRIEGDLRGKLDDVQLFQANTRGTVVTQEIRLAGKKISGDSIRVMSTDDALAQNASLVRGGSLTTADGSIVIPVLKHVTPAEQRAWYPVRAARTALTGIDSLSIIEATSDVSQLADIADREAKAKGADILRQLWKDGRDSLLLRIAAELIGRAKNAPKQGDAGLLILLGQADESTGLSEFAFERTFALALDAARRCRYVRVVTAGQGRFMGAAKRVAAEYQYTVLETAGDVEKDAKAIIEALSPF